MSYENDAGEIVVFPIRNKSEFYSRLNDLLTGPDPYYQNYVLRSKISPFMLFEDNRIKFMSISGKSTIKEYAPAEIKDPNLQKWEEYI